MRATCKECGGTAEVKEGTVLRACGHDSAGVAVELRATCHGEAVVADKAGTVRPFLRLLASVLQKMRA